jgi:hypothetical protein
MGKRSTTPVVVAAATAVVAVGAVDDEDGIQWQRWRGRLMAVAAFDGVRRRRITDSWRGVALAFPPFIVQ